LRRIVSASSNRGDCVLDPFSGSGTTVAVASQLGRDYVGIEMSEKYVENTNERLAALTKGSGAKRKNLFLSTSEVSELERLAHDMGMPLKDIRSDRKLVEVFASQFSVRMNNSKRYSADEIIPALGALAD